MLFTQDVLKHNLDVQSLSRPSDRFRKVKELWTQLDGADFERYQRLAEEDKLRVTQLYELQAEEQLQDEEEEDEDMEEG